MAGKFANILAALGLGSDKEPVTAAHLEAADTKIAQLEQDKLAAEDKAEKAATALKTAQDEKTKLAGDLKTVEDKAATLQQWKDNQASVDGREEDDSNSLDEGQKEALAPWETAAASAIEIAKKRVGKK
jgi:hypothetical protein